MAYYHVTKSTSPKLFRFHFKIPFQNYFPMPSPVPPGEGFNMAAFHTTYRIIHENHSYSFSISKKLKPALSRFLLSPEREFPLLPLRSTGKLFRLFRMSLSPQRSFPLFNEEETSAPGLFAPASVFPLPRRFRESPLFPENAASQKRAGSP